MPDLIEENRDALESVYYRLYQAALKSEGLDTEGGVLWNIWKMLDGALVNMKILEADEETEEEEEIPSEKDWADYMADQKYEIARDLMLEMEGTR